MSMEMVRKGILGKIADSHSHLGLDAIVSPFGNGVRVTLVKVMPKGIYPVATACAGFDKSPEDIVHGLWEALEKRGKDEINHLRGEAKKERLLRTINSK